MLGLLLLGEPPAVLDVDHARVDIAGDPGSLADAAPAGLDLDPVSFTDAVRLSDVGVDLAVPGIGTEIGTVTVIPIDRRVIRIGRDSMRSRMVCSLSLSGVMMSRVRNRS